MTRAAGRMTLLWLLLALGLAGLAGCEEARGEEPAAARRPLTERAAKMRASQIRGKVVTGELLGRPFTARDVRVHAIQTPGHERVDLILSEAPMTACGVPGQPVDDRSARVWIRLQQKTAFERGEHRIEPDAEGPLRAHFEVFEGGQWRGVGRAAALLVVDDVGDGSLLGRLRACFDDGRASCVEGRLLAKACRSAIDLDMLGERFIREEVEEP